jgi:hypothetical protein
VCSVEEICMFVLLYVYCQFVQSFSSKQQLLHYVCGSTFQYMFEFVSDLLLQYFTCCLSFMYCEDLLARGDCRRGFVLGNITNEFTASPQVVRIPINVFCINASALQNFIKKLALFCSRICLSSLIQMNNTRKEQE